MRRNHSRVGPRRRGPLAIPHSAVAILAMGSAISVAMMAGGCSGDGPTAGVPPSSPSNSSPVTQPGGPRPRSLEENAVRPEPAVDLRQTRWQRAEAVRGRPEVHIHATLEGGPPCTVLGRVDVQETPTAVTITLWTGRRPGARCRERRSLVGVPIVVTVALRHAVGGRAVRDGASGGP